MSDYQKLKEGIAALEAQRSILGDDVVEVALTPMREKLAALEQVELSKSALTAERKLVTIMFADVSGFTAMAEKMDPESVREVMNGCFERLVPVIEKYEGTVDKFMGDGIMVLFGAPKAHENDAERALRSALDMMEALNQFNGEGGTNLALHFGISTGLVIAGGIGTRDRQEYSVMGDAVNLAARLEDASDSGMIFVGSNTYELTAPLFEFESLPPIQVKGKAEPVPIFRLLGIKPVTDLFRGLLGSKLVGREVEFQALKQAVEHLQAGLGGIVTLVGNAGLGKSRLSAELRNYVEQQQDRGVVRPQWIEGRCLSYGTSGSYMLWIDLLRGLLHVKPDDAPETVQDHLHQIVKKLCPDQYDDVFPYLSWLLSLPLDEETKERVRKLQSKGMRIATFSAVETMIERAAGQQPLIMVCEDLHWADPTSLELFERVLSLTDRTQLLLIVLFRPDPEHGSWRIREISARQFRHRHTDLWLESLSKSESEALVENLLPLEDLSRNLRHRIIKQAEGNPFYLEEIVRALIDGGVIVQNVNTDRWQVNDEKAGFAIPDTLQRLLATRIDTLQGETKRVLQLASVIGRQFLFRVLSEIAGEEQRLDAHLLTLQQEEMIREKSRIPELEYIFKHQLTQLAAYRSLLRRERRISHRRTAEALERLFSDRVEEHVELLAYHWEQAENATKASEYLVLAGQKAASRFANAEALTNFQRAMSFVEGKVSYASILALRAKVLLEVFEGKAAAEDYERLLDLTRQNGDQEGELESLLGLATAYYTVALDEPEYVPKSADLFDQAYNFARTLDDKPGMVKALLSSIWFSDYWPEYRERAIVNIEEAWAISQELGNKELELDCIIARAHQDLASIEEVEELISQLEARRDLPRLKNAYFRLTWRHLFAGNFNRCIECCDISIDLAAKLGAPPVMYATIKALALLKLGRYSAAWASLQQEIADQDHPFGRAFKEFGLGMYYLELMAYEKAATIFASAVDQSILVGRAWLRFWAEAELSKILILRGRNSEVDMEWETQDLENTNTTLPADAPWLRGEIAFLGGNLEEALQKAEIASVEAKKRGWEPTYCCALDLQLRVLLQMGRVGDVISLVDNGIQTAEGMEYRPLMWRLRKVKAQAQALLRDIAGSTKEYSAAAGVIHELVNAIDDPQLKQVYLSSSSVLSVLESSKIGSNDGSSPSNMLEKDSI
jgi:class 3 adenylate cyclase/tetratricopeptide (TPR) repeat protein